MALSLRHKVTPRIAANRFIFAFPIQLLFVLLKKNIIIAFYWFMLFGFITGIIGGKWGAQYLFVDPEYMGQVGFVSFFIMGIAIGGFIMAINMSGYVLNAYRFPFLATLSNPFGKFVFNNCLITIVFLIAYIYEFVVFQFYNEFQPASVVIGDVIGFIIGVVIVASITIYYFYRTNKDLKKLYGVVTAEHYDFKKPHIPQSKQLLRKLRIWRVDTYITFPLKLKLVRGTAHYSKEDLTIVFKQNQRNAAVIQLTVFIFYLIMGLFRELPAFRFPAAASVVVLFSLIIMVLSAFRYIFKGWADVFFIVGFIVLNFTSQFEWFNSKNKAYGLSYDIKHEYGSKSISKHNTTETVNADIQRTITILENWKKRVISSPDEKPPLILLNVSGGGMRSATWTFRVMQYCDSLTNGEFMKHVHLITGASGGMLGAAYYRELNFQNVKENKIVHRLWGRDYFNDMGRDLLNPIIFSITVNDMFLRLQSFKIGKQSYKKDRAYAFEKQMNENLRYIFENKTLLDYQKPEFEALIPTMILTPSIINDGRKLYVSAQNVSYLCNKQPADNFIYEPEPEGVEYTRFFQKNIALNTRFTSILRMNSTFPYIQPAVSLPTKPAIEVMDAGITDNFGVRTSLKYFFTLKDWLEKNTSEVIFIQVRDTPKEPRIDDKSKKTIFENLTTPMDIFYGNFGKIQLYNQDDYMQFVSASYKGKVKFITFKLANQQELVSLSWHLTSREKNFTYNAVFSKNNRKALKDLEESLKNSTD